MAALFSCTKCHTRHPFEDLSRGEQLCKECRNKFPVVKCTYCRAEFQQDSRGTSSICKKCAENVRNYGKPTACEYCSILAAFIGGRCQRCANSERKWGMPKTCEQCKQKCAFNRGDQKKDDGKILCWLCTLAYRRVVAKTRKQRDDTRKSLGTTRKQPSTKTPPTKAITDTKLDKIFGPSKTENIQKSSSSVDTLLKFSGVGKPAKQSLLDKNKHLSPGSPASGGSLSEKAASLLEKTKEKPNKSKSRSSLLSEDESSQGKKPRLEKTSSNGVTTPKSNSNSSFTEASKMDSVSSDHVIVITQLKDQIESLKKQLQVKDSLLKEKDKKISELKVSEFQLEKELRGKLQSLNFATSNTIDTLQSKNKELMRQVATLSKQKDKKGTSSAVPSPAPNTQEL
ncbi:protein FAM76B [Patella vulgata]|uniref:protein FAM76B n=1 Tax=Patella vulgata TaxID=6465 RepID=UPI00217F9B8B|nr:protein FAM76B [Patella vulgata]